MCLDHINPTTSSTFSLQCSLFIAHKVDDPKFMHIRTAFNWPSCKTGKDEATLKEFSLGEAYEYWSFSGQMKTYA